MHKSYPRANPLPFTLSLKQLLCPHWREEHSEQTPDSHVMSRTILRDQKHVCCPLASMYRDFGIHPHPVALWSAVKCHLASAGDPRCGARRPAQLWQGSSCRQTGVSLWGWDPAAAPAHKQHKLTRVCNSRRSVLDRLTVSRQHSAPFCSEVSFC